jgi:type IV pilus assembly protein PilV
VRAPRARSAGVGAGTARGFALLEVMVAMVILLVGLLGLAGVSNRANSAELESYQRIQAIQLLDDMADRLNANRKVASCYSNGTAGVQLGVGGSAIPACTSGSIQQQTQAAADLSAWSNLLQGESEVLAGSKLGGMIGALGCITLDDPANKVYLISVSWQGLAKTAAPTLSDGSAFPCGNGKYGDERLHRVVTTKVRIGALS